MPKPVARSIKRSISQVERRQQKNSDQLALLRSSHQSDQAVVNFLEELESQSSEIAEGLRLIANQLSEAPAGKPKSKRRGRGRPSRSDTVDEQLLSEAPFSELVTETAHRLGPIIRGIDDPVLLEQAHAFELHHDRRRRVLNELQTRLRKLGHPLGGPPRPLMNYEKLDQQEIIGQLVGCSKEVAADVYAFEYYQPRKRRLVLEAAAHRCGQDAADRRVAETDPSRIDTEPEPFPGYDLLQASPQKRQQVRDALGRQDRGTLERALAYEEATKDRKVLKQAIQAALRSR